MSNNNKDNNNVQVRDLSVVYTFGKASFKAVKNVDFDIKAGEIVGLIGESGSGKTSTAKAILGQIPFFADSVNINGIDIPHLPELKNKKLKNRIANNIQMIYQSPSASLNPYKRVWKAVAEGMYNIKLSKEEAAAHIDNIQKKFVGQIFEYNKKLKSEKIAKLIKEYNTVLTNINKVNEIKLSINKDNLTFLKNEKLVQLDKKYNDLIDAVNNKLGTISTNLALRIDSALRNTKKRYKARFENVDINTDLDIKSAANEFKDIYKLKVAELKKVKADKITTLDLDSKFEANLVAFKAIKSEENSKVAGLKKVKADKVKELNEALKEKISKLEDKSQALELKNVKVAKIEALNEELKTAINKSTEIIKAAKEKFDSKVAELKKIKADKIIVIDEELKPKFQKALDDLAETKPGTKVKVAELRKVKAEKLKAINDEMKEKLNKIHDASKGTVEESNIEKEKLKVEYAETLSLYEAARTKLIKEIRKGDDSASTQEELTRVSSALEEAKAKFKISKKEKTNQKEFKELKEKLLNEIKELKIKKRKISNSITKSLIVQDTKNRLELVNSEISSLYGSARELDDTIRDALRAVAAAKGLGSEFAEHEADIDSKLKRAIKFARRPFGDRKEIKERALKLIEEVGLNKKIGTSYIPQLSGGQQQRVAIARAFAMNPKFIIADEPIASLDVSLQGSVVNLIKDFAEQRGTAVLFITHDLDMVRRIASRMLVMYRGNVVERGNTKNIFETPVHPYTRMLMSSSLTIDEALEGKENYIYTGKEHITSKEETKYFSVGKDHDILANAKEVKAWGGK